MSRARRCDRCGLFYKEIDPYKAELCYKTGHTTCDTDLCIACTEALQEFMNDGNAEKPKTYVEHFLSNFPDAEIANDGFPSACAKHLYKEICCKGRCSRNCVKCWSQPLPPIPEAKEPNQ